MRAIALAVVVIFALLPLAPAASADWARHYGSLYRGCGPDALFDVPEGDCPWTHHGGYLQVDGCEGETCALRLWHGTSAHAWEARPMSMRGYLAVGSAEVDLCVRSGNATAIGCWLEGERVAFPLDEGCSRLAFRTDARNDGALFLARSETFFTVCREGNEVSIGPSDAWQWVGHYQWECAGTKLGLFFWGCWIGTSGVMGVSSCDVDTCDVVGEVSGGVVANVQGPKSVLLELVTPGGTVPVCAAADVTFHVVCGDDVATTVPLAVGECTTLSLRATVLQSQPTGLDVIEPAFTACRFDGWVQFENV